MLQYLCCLFILATGVQAVTPSKYAVETIEPIPAKIKEKYPEARFKTSEDVAPSDIAPMEIRNQYFDQIGLKSELSKMDEADKDILHWRLKHASLDKLKKWYPQFPSSVWAKLQTEGQK